MPEPCDLVAEAAVERLAGRTLISGTHTMSGTALAGKAPSGAIARQRGVGAILESATWRANPDWAAKLGYDAATLATVQRRRSTIDGDPDELAQDYRAMLPLLPRLAVVGGCCGTDHRHVDAMARATLGWLGSEL